ncbi:MAG: recombination mediator RecR [Alphaproteobacteria bacterium]|nr:recombination mediator RecR [Alphaproteobacteria bacterium]
MNDNPLEHLIKLLGSLPGLGNRSARRIALHLLSKRGGLMVPLAEALKNTAENIKNCHICNTLDMTDPCQICRDIKRDKRQICVVAQVSDVWAIERTGAFKGTYHVLGGLLSALDGIGPEDLGIERLKLRLEEMEGKEGQEVILALSATVDGQSTAHYIADILWPLGIKVSRLAHGMPVGGELDYLDDGTITTALRSRA